MGIEDRDWYREESAKKDGMLYNKKNATYSGANSWYNPKQFRGSSVVPEHWQPEIRKPSKNRWPFLLQLSVTITICGFIFVVLKIISQLAR